MSSCEIFEGPRKDRAWRAESSSACATHTINEIDSFSQSWMCACESATEDDGIASVVRSSVAVAASFSCVVSCVLSPFRIF